ncbi:hypothetical protein KQI63_11600 [bacterium]|nr:hypothetical protein [bacterium]
MFDDVLWGSVVHAIGDNVFEVHITYQPSMNRGSYGSLERVRLVDPTVYVSPSFTSSSLLNPPSQSGEMSDEHGRFVGKNVVLRVLERNQDDLHCEVSLMV